MSNYYGVYRVVGSDSNWLFIGTQKECNLMKDVFGLDTHVRELVGEPDEIWSIRAEVARANGEPEPLIFEDDQPLTLGISKGTDTEMELNNNYGVFEEYIRLTKEREPLQKKWIESFRSKKNTWWSFFREEAGSSKIYGDKHATDTGWNFLELKLYEDLSNHYLNIKNPNGIYSLKSDKDKWVVFSWIWQGQMEVTARCLKLQDKRWDITNKIYQKAMEWNEKCSAFWNTPEGKKLNYLNERRSIYWEIIQELDCSFEDYNTLLQEEITPYWTTGDTEEVDDMTLSLPSMEEYLDILENSSRDEDKAMEERESIASPFWDYGYRKDNANRDSPVYYVRDNATQKGHGASQSGWACCGGQGCEKCESQEDWNSLLQNSPF